MTDLEKLMEKEFHERFGTPPLLIQSPGRINLIGEHVDYNLGFVLPGAIDKHFVFAVAPSTSDHNRIYAHDFQKLSEFSPDELTQGAQWFNYFMGVVDGFRKQGKKVDPVDCVFGGTIPPGAGLSSSAALCGGFGFALNELFRCGLSRLELALIAQHSEHAFAGVNCGLMDQYASLFGEPDRLLLLDCRSNTHEVVPFPSAECTIVLADTNVKHSLASSAYNNRRAACEEGLRQLQVHYSSVQSLRDVSLAQLEAVRAAMSPEVYRRCHFIVEEIGRTRQAATELRKGNLENVGQLMFAAHEGLRSEYEVSCPELDGLVSAARKHPELVVGARMMGGGFGGCTINLVKPGALASFQSLVSTEYFASFRNTPDFYVVSLAEGTHRLKP